MANAIVSNVECGMQDGVPTNFWISGVCSVNAASLITPKVTSSPRLSPFMLYDLERIKPHVTTSACTRRISGG